MGFFSEIKKRVQYYNTVYQLAQEVDDLLGRFHKMVEVNEPHRQMSSDTKEKLKDLKELIIKDLLDRKMEGLADSSRQKLAECLKKYGAQNTLEAIASIAGEINDSYNLRDTDEAKWLDLKVQFFEYRAKNYQELTELEKFKNEAEFLKANYLVKKAKEAYQELVDEENTLREMLENLKPENYKASGQEAKFVEDHYKTANLIQEKLSLYNEQRRTPLLRAHKRLIEAGQEERSALEGLTQSAQALRKEDKEASTAEVIKSEQGRTEKNL